MKILNFVKDHIMTILTFIMLVVLVVWSIFIISDRDASADVTPGDVVSEPLTENNEPLEVVTGPYRYFNIPLDEYLG